jgi:hypothetical protein
VSEDFEGSVVATLGASKEADDGHAARKLA